MRINYRRIFVLALIVMSYAIAYSQVVFEAEDAYYSSGKIDDKHLGFTGDGFVDTENAEGEYIEWNVYSYKDVIDTIAFRYALGKEEVRSMQCILNNELIDTISFDNTIEFTNYEYKHTVGALNTGANTIKLVAINPNGAPNIDHLTVKTDTNLYFKINASSAEGGMVEQTPVADSLIYGTRVKLKAINNSGYSFKGWSGDYTGINNPIAFTVDKEFSYTASYIFSLPAFPGAEGFGSKASGGRGGVVKEVTNLNDSGDGSLRAAIQVTGPRTVIFRVSGTIELKSALSIKNGFLTIAGQTAPGDGITVSGYPIKINADNVIIRYIRSRLGPNEGVQDDAINCRGYSNIIIDHCSFSWSVDEVSSFYDNSKFTMQYCVVSEALYNSIHDKGKHSYGGIWGGKGVSFHHNLLAHNTSRNPRFCGSRYSNQPDLELVDFRNNVLFNWGFNSVYGAEGGSYNLVNNYYKHGPATSSNVSSRIIAPNASIGTNNQPAGIWGVFYVDGNYVTASETVTDNNWAGVHVSGVNKEDIKSYEPFVFDSVTTHSAQLANEHVLAQVGAVLPNRDDVDKRIIQEVLSSLPEFGSSYGEGTGIIDSPNDVGGWPELESKTPLRDTDSDGLPDDWEDANGLDKSNPDDRNDDMNGDGYTNLESYLNSLVGAYVYVIRPINFEIESVSDLNVNFKWDDVLDNETGFVLERKELDGQYEVVANITQNEIAYTDNLPVKGKYVYRLAAVKNDLQSYYTDTLYVDAAVGISVNSGNNFKIYPNPFKNSIQIESGKSELSRIRIRLSDVLGHIILDETIMQAHPATLNVEDLNNGVYFIHLSNNTESFVQKIVKN